MDTDRQINMAIASGERNKEVMELIRNWCRHARVDKFGGRDNARAQQAAQHKTRENAFRAC